MLQQERGWNSLVGAIPFLAVLIGIAFGAVINILNQKLYMKRLIANNNIAVPEARLFPMMIGSIFLAGGLFIMGWTFDKSVAWIGYLSSAIKTESIADQVQVLRWRCLYWPWIFHHIPECSQLSC
jgi:hypothetical protein